MHEHPALALREKKDASILVACDLVKRGRADAVITAGHTGAGDGRRRPAAGPRARRRPAGARGPAGHRVRPARPARHRRQPRLDRPRTCSSTPTWASLFAERVARRRRDPRVALLSIGEEKGKGDARIQRADRAARRVEPQLHGQRRGQGPRPPPGRRRRLRRGPGQRDDQVLRGPRRASSSTCWREEFRRPPAGPTRLRCSCGPGSAGSGARSTTRCSAARPSSACAGR